MLTEQVFGKRESLGFVALKITTVFTLYHALGFSPMNSLS